MRRFVRTLVHGPNAQLESCGGALWPVRRSFKGLADSARFWSAPVLRRFRIRERSRGVCVGGGVITERTVEAKAARYRRTPRRWRDLSRPVRSMVPTPMHRIVEPSHEPWQGRLGVLACRFWRVSSRPNGLSARGGDVSGAGVAEWGVKPGFDAEIVRARRGAAVVKDE